MREGGSVCVGGGGGDEHTPNTNSLCGSTEKPNCLTSLLISFLLQTSEYRIELIGCLNQ